MPGVITSTANRPGAGSTVAPRAAQYLVVGLTERGPTTPTEVRSFSQFQALFGERVTYGFLTDDLQTFFREDGARAVVQRVVGPGATKGSLTLNNADGDPTLRLAATSAGAWSAGVAVQISAGNLAGTFSVTTYIDGALENRYSNLPDVATAIDKLSQSQLIDAISLGNGNPAPTTTTSGSGSGGSTLPAALPLSAGDDDRAAVDVAALLAAVNNFTAEYGVGAIAIPGYSADLIAGALIDHANTYDRQVILHGPVEATRADIAQLANSLLSATGDVALIGYPWGQVPGPGILPLTVPPTGYIAAMRSRAHVQVGAWRAPIGDIAKSNYLVGLAGEPITTAQANALDDAHVSVIRNIGGSFQLYGFRSLSTDETTYKLATTRDATNVVLEDLVEELAPLIGANVDADGAFYLTAQTKITGYLDPIRTLGGLYPRVKPDGTQADPGYVVRVNRSLNEVGSLARNEVYAEVGLRWSPIAEVIFIKVTTVGLDVDF
jgi:hypothetical protein